MKLKPLKRKYYLRYIKRQERLSRRIAKTALEVGYWADGHYCTPIDFRGADYNYLVHIMRSRLTEHVL